MALSITDAELLMLPLAGEGCIIADPAIQQRVELDHAKVDEYAELYADGRDLYHLIVFQTDEGLLLVDGFHRRLAAQAAGLSTLPCAVFPGTRRDAILRACGSNLHGKPLTNADKRRRVETMLADPEWAQWSDNSIAKHCGVAHSFVSKIRQALSLDSESSEDTTSPSLDSESSDNGMGVSLPSESSDNGTSPTRRTYRNRYGQVRTMDTSRVGHVPPAPPSKVTVTEDGWTMYDPPPSTLTERQRSCAGPRNEKPPGSVEWCWQTLYLLKIQWQRKDLTNKEFAETLQELREHEAWNVVPPEEPYGTLADLLSAELGLDRFSAEVLAPDHPLHKELRLPSKVDNALHEALWHLETLETYYRATPQLFALHGEGYLALTEACRRFAALCDPAEPPAPAPTPPSAPDPTPPRRRDTVELQQAVFQTVKQLQPCTNAQVKEVHGTPRNAMFKVLQALVKQGKVVKEGETYRTVNAPA